MNSVPIGFPSNEYWEMVTVVTPNSLNLPVMIPAEVRKDTEIPFPSFLEFQGMQARQWKTWCTS
jgi:hypothetical protein